MSSKRLIEKMLEKNSVLCVGLDPVVNQLPETLKQQIEAEGKTVEAAAKAILTFNKAIIDAVHDLVAVVKPQSAYYELLGVEGMKAYQETVRYAQSKGLYVIGDIKRGDIGSTSAAYAKAHLGTVDILGTQHSLFHTDAITINPYLGDDSNNEFYKVAKASDSMNFVLVKTSNPSSHQLQNKISDKKTVYEWVAETINNNDYNEANDYGYSDIGAVVGATYPEELQHLRDLMPKTVFLIPGYGAQGGTAADIIGGFDTRGLGAIVNSSRGIIFAYEKGDGSEHYTHYIREAAIRANEDLNGALAAAGKTMGGTHVN